jgi:hypothetical protein
LGFPLSCSLAAATGGSVWVDCGSAFFLPGNQALQVNDGRVDLGEVGDNALNRGGDRDLLAMGLLFVDLSSIRGPFPCR